MEGFLVPEKTVVTGEGDGQAVELKPAQGSVYLLTLSITNIVEQESLDVRVHGSPDGVDWDPKPLAAFPQKFQRGETPLLLDLAARPEVKFIRAHWVVARWGRSGESPMFEFHVMMREIPMEILAEAAERAPSQ